MISRLAHASVRGFLVSIMVMIPSLMLPNVTRDTAEIIALVSIFAAVLTIIEYYAIYPSIVEFRDAPPFNRVRFFSIFATVILLSVICRGQINPNSFSTFMEAVGVLIGQVLNFPFSPLRLTDLMMADGATDMQVELVHATAGLSFFISLICLSIFVINLHMTRWPKEIPDFNVWVNLPTFDPSAGSDVVKRLNRDAFLNVGIGLIMPYFIPLIIWAATSVFRPIDLTSYHSLIWACAAWAFLPVSLFMRGIAMRRVAEMISEKRRRGEEAGATLMTV